MNTHAGGLLRFQGICSLKEALWSNRLNGGRKNSWVEIRGGDMKE